VATPPLPFLPRQAAATVDIQDLDVTAPDLEALGNGVDARETSLGVAAAGGELVAGLLQADHCLLGLQALQRTEAPLASLLLGTDPELAAATQAELAMARSRLIAKLVPRVLAMQPRPDLELALGFIGGETKRAESLKLLASINTSFGMDFRRVAALALVGTEHCRLHGLAKPADQFQQLYMRACWGRRLAELNIDFKTAFNGGRAECVVVLREMVKRPEVGVKDLLLYTRAFSIQPDEALTIYSEVLIGQMVPRIDERTREVVVDNFTEVTTKIEAALQLIKADDVLLSHLEKQLDLVSPYNYEVLQFLLSRLHGARAYRERAGQGEAPGGHLAKADRILGFLMQYTRVAAPPAEHEVNLVTYCMLPLSSVTIHPVPPGGPLAEGARRALPPRPGRPQAAPPSALLPPVQGQVQAAGGRVPDGHLSCMDECDQCARAERRQRYLLRGKEHD
jgi:hypothetical protein